MSRGLPQVRKLRGSRPRANLCFPAKSASLSSDESCLRSGNRGRLSSWNHGRQSLIPQTGEFAGGASCFWSCRRDTDLYGTSANPGFGGGCLIESFKAFPISKDSNSIMNRKTILLIVAVGVMVGCSRPGIKGDGVLKTESRPISGFSALEATGGYKIEWSKGKPALTISTDQNLLPLIKTTVSGQTLQIDWEENLVPTRGIKIVLSSASLADVKLNGGISLTARQLSGSDLKLESNGASDISVDGSVTNLEVNLSGASRLNAKSLPTRNATLSLTGASFGDVTVTETLDASIAGAGVLTYSGNPKSVEKHVSGAGSIRPRP